MNTMRSGMQVHAVPDNEKAFDANGRRLPWAFEYADGDITRRKDQEEKGPFGRSQRRRGFSRSKTATPARKEDIQRLENVQAEDAIFNSYKASQRTRDALVTSKSAPLLTLDSNANAGAITVDKEATEVILYGYGKEHEWAAIEFYERISGGSVLEDYDRHPPNQRYDAALSLSRAASQRSLSKAALRKRNNFRGGLHWIKVTFDSPEAADLACDRSPHTLHGYLVYAEPYRGAGPPNDAAIPCTNAGAQVDSQALPNTFSTNNLPLGRAAESPDSSQTASSATIGAREAPIPMKDLRSTRYEVPGGFMSTVSTLSMPSLVAGAVTERASARQRPMRIPGATRAVLRPAEQALMPAPAPSSGWMAVLSWLFSSGQSPSTSTQIPRLEDGTVDWKNASAYWRFFSWIDTWLGTDLCGLKSDD